VAFKGRVTYVYKQALMALRFVPEIWFEAADFCFLNDMVNDGNDFLKQGIEANPDSCLLAFKQGDRLEITSESDNDSLKRALKVREPYDKVIDALFDLSDKGFAKQAEAVSRIKETFAKEKPDHKLAQNHDDDDSEAKAKENKAALDAQIAALKKTNAPHLDLIAKIISFAWIALMRAMRRIQGKGKAGEELGSRSIFAEARKRGRITSDVYIASALMEYHCYKDPSATKIFERGAKLFPQDENFALEYLKHLIDINDIISKSLLALSITLRILTYTQKMLELYSRRQPEDLPLIPRLFRKLSPFLPSFTNMSLDTEIWCK
jgi:cleavage stimulation factor subunit 3